MTSVNDGIGWDLVQKWLEQELSTRGISKAVIVREAKVDQRTIDKLLDGKGIARQDRLAAIAASLGYRGDAFDLVRRGEPPVPLAPADDETDLRFRAVERRLDRIEALLEAALPPLDRSGDAR